MTSDELKLKELAEAATPGPWVHRNNDGSIGSVDAASGQMIAQTQALRPPSEQCNKERNINAAFIAAANPTAILSLISRIEELETKYELAVKGWKLNVEALKLTSIAQQGGKND